MKDAGIKVWVLTGDKVETAINIGISAGLLDEHMVQHTILANDEGELKQELDDKLQLITNNYLESSCRK